MEKLYSNMVGAHVCDEDFGRPITTVKDVVIDPENGKLIGVIVNLSKNLVITPVDILNWNANIRIHNHEAIVEGHEIFRLDEVQKGGIKIYHNKVYTKDGKYLGIVIDFSVGSDDLILKKIFVAKIFLGLLRMGYRIFPAKKIVEILPDKIVVENDLGEVKDKEEAKVEDLAVG